MIPSFSNTVLIILILTKKATNKVSDRGIYVPIPGLEVHRLILHGSALM